MSPRKAPTVPPASLAGSVILPLLALWISFSCSRYFGVHGLAGLPDLTIERFCAGLLLGYTVITLAVRRWPVGTLLPAETGLLAFTLACGVSAFLHGQFDSGKGADTMNGLSNLALYPAIAFMIVTRTQTSSRDLMWCSAILTLFGIYLGVTAILERSPYTWALIPPEIADPAQGMHWGRSRGPFLNAAYQGTVLGQLLPVAMLLREIGTRVWRRIAVVGIALICVGVYLSDTRMCLLALVLVTLVGSVIESPSRKTYRFLFGALVFGALIRYTIGAVLVPRLEDTDPVDTRMNLILASIEMIAAHPLLGVGFGTFQEMSREFYNAARIFGNLSYQEGWTDVGSHNNFLTPLAEVGLLVGGLYIFLTGRIIASGLREPLGRTPEEQRLVRGLLTTSVLIGVPFVVNGLSGDFRASLTPNALFWTFGAFTERHLRMSRNAAPQSSSDRSRQGVPHGPAVARPR